MRENPIARIGPLLCSALACLGLLFSFSANSAEADLQAHIDAANAALGQLDSMAGGCLTALDSAGDDIAQQRCREFLDAIDGETLAQYLAHCEALKQWRDDFVNTALASGTDRDSSTQNLQYFIGTEHACGENALQKRTQFVSNAFTLLQEGQMQDQPTTAALTRRLAELQFEATLNAERQLLQDSVLQQRLRTEQETLRQMHKLENELIKQQLRSQNQ